MFGVWCPWPGRAGLWGAGDWPCSAVAGSETDGPEERLARGPGPRQGGSSALVGGRGCQGLVVPSAPWQEQFSTIYFYSLFIRHRACISLPFAEVNISLHVFLASAVKTAGLGVQMGTALAGDAWAGLSPWAVSV